MSAYICDTDTIDYIVSTLRKSSGRTFYLRGPYAEQAELIDAGIISAETDRISWTEHERIGAILYFQNRRSVQARYPHDAPTELPGPINAPLDYTYQFVNETNPVVALASMDCLEYQSCETDDYRQTLAYALLEWLKDCAIRMLVGYDDAPWGWTRKYEAEQKAAIKARIQADMERHYLGAIDA